MKKGTRVEGTYPSRVGQDSDHSPSVVASGSGAMFRHLGPDVYAAAVVVDGDVAGLAVVGRAVASEDGVLDAVVEEDVAASYIAKKDCTCTRS